MSDRKTAVTSPYVIGTAPFRPGDEADFGGKFTEQPNDLNRPDPTKCSADDTIKHASGLVRVLNDNGEAEGEWIPQHISRAVDYWSRIYDEAENF